MALQHPGESRRGQEGFQALNILSLWRECGGAGEKCGKEEAADEQLGTDHGPYSPTPEGLVKRYAELGMALEFFIFVFQHPTLF